MHNFDTFALFKKTGFMHNYIVDTADYISSHLTHITVLEEVDLRIFGH